MLSIASSLLLFNFIDRSPPWVNGIYSPYLLFSHFAPGQTISVSEKPSKLVNYFYLVIFAAWAAAACCPSQSVNFPPGGFRRLWSYVVMRRCRSSAFLLNSSFWAAEAVRRNFGSKVILRCNGGCFSARQSATLPSHLAIQQSNHIFMLKLRQLLKIIIETQKKIYRIKFLPAEFWFPCQAGSEIWRGSS